MTPDERQIRAILKRHKGHTDTCTCRDEVKVLAWRIYDRGALDALHIAYQNCDGGHLLDLWFDGIYRKDKDGKLHGWFA